MIRIIAHFYSIKEFFIYVVHSIKNSSYSLIPTIMKICSKLIWQGTLLYVTTTLVQPVLLWPFLLLVHFGADLFGTNFMKIIFFICFLFQFFNL